MMRSETDNRALKSLHLRQLAEAAATPGLPQYMLNRIETQRRKVAACDPAIDGGLLGFNGYLPAVRDVCRDVAGYADACEKQRRNRAERNRQLVEMATYGRPDAAELMEAAE